MIPEETDFQVPAADGHRIRGVSWKTAASPLAHVQIAHGRGEHGRRYARAAQHLVRAGFWVHASDHRGHGPAERLRRFGFADVTTHVYGGVRHEPFNDLTREEVLDTTAAWMRRVASSAAGGNPSRHS